MTGTFNIYVLAPLTYNTLSVSALWFIYRLYLATVLLLTTPLAPDPPSRRRRSHHALTTRLYIVIALVISRLDILHFFASRASTLYNRTVPTRSERRCSTDIRTQSLRAHHTKPTPVTRYTGYPYAGASSSNLLYACSCHRTLSSVSAEHRATS